MLIHLVDAANPRWQQQIASVDRILTELEFDRIPRLLVFNKADKLDAASLNAMKRAAGCRDAGDCVDISALRPQTLMPLLTQIGQMLSRNLAGEDSVRFADERTVQNPEQ